MKTFTKCVVLLSLILLVSITYLIYVRPGPTVSESPREEMATLYVQQQKTPMSNSCVQGGRRYVVGVSYWEQFGMAVRNMLQLAALANDWGSRVVEPYIVNSRMFGLRELIFSRNPATSDLPSRKDHLVTPLLLRELLDVDRLSEGMCSYGIPGIVSHEEFVGSVVQDLIIIQFVHMYSNPSDLNVPPDLKVDMLVQFKSSNIVDCSFLLASYRDKIVVALEQEANLRPIVRGYYCVDATKLITSHQLAELVELDTYEHLTVIVVDWHGYSSHSMVYHSAHGRHVNKRVTLSTSYVGPSLATLGLYHSERVKNAVLKYRQLVGLPNSYISVHIRSEKMGHVQLSQAGFVSSCLKKMYATIEQLKKLYDIDHVVICMDAGVRGSDSCANCRGSSETLKILRKYQLQVTHVDPTLIGEVDDSGLVALMEMNLLSTGDHLVMVGGGSFQNQTGRHFIEYHDNQRYDNHITRIHEVCTKR